MTTMKLRLLIGLLLEIATLLIGWMPVWDYGVYDQTKFWYAAQNFCKEFLVIFLPTITMLFLLPVIIRGSPAQKIAAIILSLLPVWIAIPGWLEIIARFSES